MVELWLREAHTQLARGDENKCDFILRKVESQIELITALLARKVGGRVRMLVTREETFITHRGRPETDIRIKMGMKKDGTIKVQIRDVALVILLRMTGKDPGQFGFKLLRENPQTLYYAYTFGFIDDTEREAAHANWADQMKDEG